MKKYLFLLTLFFFVPIANASHVMGGEITWKCSGNNSYIFELIFYRDCNGAEINTASEALRVWNHPSLTTLNLAYISREDISPSCTAVSGGPLPLDCGSGTSGGNGIGAIERITYRSNPITLSGTPPSQGWIFTYENFSRSNSLTNITSPASYGITLAAKMFALNQNSTCVDNSPVFMQAPYFVSCAGSNYRYNMNAIDPDLDSLYIDFGIPYNNFPTGSYNPPLNPIPVPFEPGFSALSPTPNASMNAANIPAQINHQNGEITFNSSTIGNFAVKVSVKSYRQGILISEVEREMQLVITACTSANNAPIFSAPFSSGSFITTVNAGDLVNLNLIANDLDLLQDGSNQNVSITASGPMFGTNYNQNTGCTITPCAFLNTGLPITGTSSASVDFTWQTHCNHLINAFGEAAEMIPYIFVFRAQDNYCQVPKVSYATLQINVRNPGIIPAPSIDCIQGDANGNVNISWTASSDPVNSFVSYQIYSVQGGLLATITDINTTQFLLNGGSTPQAYYLGVVSGCNGTITKYSDTISAIHLNLINPNNGTAVLQWNQAINPPLNSFNAYYYIYREYPAGVFQLIDSVDYNTTQYKDTIDICQANLGYQIVLPNAPCNFTSNIPHDDFEDMMTPNIPIIQSVGFDPNNNNNLVLTWNQNQQEDTYGYVIYTFDQNGILFELDTVWGISNTSYSYHPDYSQGPLSYSVAAFDSCYTNAVPITFQTSAKGAINTTVFCTGSADMCGQSVNLNWNAYGGQSIVNYNLYSFENGALIYLGSSDNNQATIPLTGGQQYQIYVQANLSNGQSSLSNPFVVDIPLPQQPAYHYLKLATVQGNSVDLSVYIDGTVGVKEVIFEKLNSVGNFEVIGQSTVIGNTAQFTDINADAEIKPSTYRSQYVDSCTNAGGYSNLVTTMYLTGIADEMTQINYLNWTPYEGFDGTVEYYEIFRLNKNTGISQAIGTSNSGQRSTLDTVNSSQYPGEICYYVTAHEVLNSYGFYEVSKSNIFCLSYAPIIYIPNAFYPDGINAIFLPVLTNIDPKDYLLTIIDRWDNVVFETNNPSIGWDGKLSNGNEASNDNFVYIVEVHDATGKEIIKRGFVSLIR